MSESHECILQNGLQPPFMMCIYGKSNSGKSHMLRYIMHQINKHSLQTDNTPRFDYGIVMCPTVFVEGCFDYIPSKYIHNEFNPEIVQNLMKLQQKNQDKQAFLILDDLGDDDLKHPVLKELAKKGHHYNITTFILTQYVHLLPPSVRANTFYALGYNVGEGKREMSALYEAYGARIGSECDFKKFYFEAILDHQCVFWDLQCNSQDRNGCSYQIVKAPAEIPPFNIKYRRKLTGK